MIDEKDLGDFYNGFVKWVQASGRSSSYFTFNTLADYIQHLVCEGRNSNGVFDEGCKFYISNSYTYITGTTEGVSCIWKYHKDVYLNPEPILKVDIDGTIRSVVFSSDDDVYIATEDRVYVYDKDLNLKNMIMISNESEANK